MAGFAARAGKIVAGEQGVCLAAVSGKAKLVLLAQDTGPHTTENVLRACGSRVPVWRMEEADPGYHCGKSGRKVLGIIDAGFATRLAAALPGEGTLEEPAPRHGDRDKTDGIEEQEE